MPYCSQCGTSNTESDAFCKKCGTALPKTVAASGSTYTSASSRSSATGTSSTQSGITTLNILTALCVLFCQPCAIYGFYCQYKAGRSTGAEAVAYVQKGVKVCKIGLLVMVCITVLALLFQ